MAKYCRICWNTRHWREPTGEAAESETARSYVQQNGFGHEEWLFNFAWLHPPPDGSKGAVKYGFLQPIGKYRETYEGQTLDILVYTVAPDRRTRIAVATIRDVYVPLLKEIQRAVAIMRKNGWLEEMRDDLAAQGISAAPLNGSADSICNIRFEPSRVRFFDPRIALPSTHKTYRINRYQPLDWDGRVPGSVLDTGAPKPPKGGKRRSEDDRTRAAVQGTTYSPHHVRLQNALYDYLCGLHGASAVRYEVSFVDLTLTLKNATTYFEIKIANTAKSCIREAVGQLLEYGCYPDQRRASKFVVVGDVEADMGEKIYIQHLRREFNLPIYYRRWDWSENILENEI